MRCCGLSAECRKASIRASLYSETMKRPNHRLVMTLTVAAVCLGALAFAATSWAASLSDSAQAGKAQAKAGVASLAARDATAAVAQFGAASESFRRADAMLGPEWLGGVANTLPHVGRQYSVTRTLVAIGLDGSAAGLEMAALLRDMSAAPSSGTTQGLGSFLATGRAHIDAALVSLCNVADRSAGLSEEGLLPPLAKAVHSAKEPLAQLGPVLRKSRALLTLDRYLLSAKRSMVVISQNNAELRPTGGFAGTYGVVGVSATGIALEEYADTYSLPDPPGRVTPPPGALMTKDFGFRDAGWWIDYPTSARAMLGFWKDYGQRPVDGMISVDIVAVRDLLDVFGPIELPYYKETFTSSNLLSRLMYLIEVKLGTAPGHKDVLVALANELERRVLNAGSDDLMRAALSLAKSADQKHVQVYLSDPAAQAAVVALGWSGSVAPPAGSTDALAISNAMNLPGKVNVAMRKSSTYEVALMLDGSAETTLVLHYANQAPRTFVISKTVFRDYLRVLRAPGTLFLPGPGSASGGSTTTVETGLPTAVRTFSLTRGKAHEETIVSRVPGAWRRGRAISLPGSPGEGATPPTADTSAHYRLFIVRQADLEEIPTTMTITPPAGWRVSRASAWRMASGAVVATSGGERMVRLAWRLDGDLVLDVVIVPR